MRLRVRQRALSLAARASGTGKRVALTVGPRLLYSRGPASACESMHVKIEFDGFGRGDGRTRRAGRADGRAGANGIAGTVLAATAGAVHRRPRARKRAGHRAR